MLHAFPKIFAIGSHYILDIFNEPVEITEKIDGSQFSFGKVNGQLHIRSKGAKLYVDNPEKMFLEGIAYVDSIQDLLPEGIVFYGEYLKKPKHNTLTYSRVPKNHVILFGAMNYATGEFDTEYYKHADQLGLETVPRYTVSISNAESLMALLDQESILGGAKIEGVVVKNYARKFLLGDQYWPLMSGKYVSEAFKEVNGARWSAEEKGTSKWSAFCQSYRTEARWHKAVQHLAEDGQLDYSPKDIGKLLKAVNQDIEAEEEEAIKTWLYNEHRRELLKVASMGLPEWYKRYLVDRSFEEVTDATL